MACRLRRVRWPVTQEEIKAAIDNVGFNAELQSEEGLKTSGDATILECISAEVKAGDCACELRNPSGKCCLGDVTKASQGVHENPN